MGKLGIVAALVVVSGCGGAARDGGTVKVDGSSTVYLITEAVAEEFRNEEPRVRVIVGRSGTGGGFKKFSHGEIDVCDASRPISDSEKEACEKAGVDYIELEVAFDGLAMVVNPKNDWLDCVTVEQLKSIWEPGSKAKTWSDVDPAWPKEEVKLYGPGTDSGTFDYFTEVIVGESGKSRDDYTQSEDDNVLVTGVAGDEFSMGYFGLAYYEENREKLKLLGVDPGDGKCVKPTLETVRDNSYHPLSRPLYIYVRRSSLERPEVREFVKFYLEEVGKLVTAVGYVPVTDEVAAKNKGKFDEAIGEKKPAA